MPELDFDPIARASEQWSEHGWADSADGMAAVTSLMRAHQLVLVRVEAALEQSSVTNAVDRLENAGLVTRGPHPTDRRATIVALTADGRELTDKATEAINRDVFGDLGLSDQDARDLTRILTSLRRAAGDF